MRKDLLLICSLLLFGLMLTGCKDTQDRKNSHPRLSRGVWMAAGGGV